ncbi:hypothetical protein [Nitrospira lenta]|uniref:Transport-associated OB type 2 domain-containing protein n=1 Tax=Nitrospira lenta TaxID=1436998 RepID=A0A330KZN4_9BACT|nr:hypothetical protein [Nitrospira lenta]SPP62955.1 hypothetical protein NITLEN_10041 [Nitrospira lenta]
MAMLVRDSEIDLTLSSHSGTPRRVINRIMGTILAVAVQSQQTLYVRTDDGGVLDLEIDDTVCAPEVQRFFEAGHRVLLAIDAADVKVRVLPSAVSAGCNEWVGRVVLVERDRGLVTVKIRGQQVTLKSLSMDIGQGRALQVWDCVTLSIAPGAMRVVPLGTCARLQRRLLVSRVADESSSGIAQV